MKTVQRKFLIAALLVVLGLVLIGGLFWWLWGVLVAYIDPDPKNPTQKKDLVNIFVVIAAGVVGTLTTIAAVGNLIISRMNLQNAQASLQQERDLDDRRAQEDALQAYLEYVTPLINEGLSEDHPLSPRRLALRSRTLNVFWQLDPNRKRAVLEFLREAGLIRNEEHPIIGLSGVDLRGASLRELNLREAKLNGADLKGAALSGACLRDTDLGGADFSVYDETEKAADLTGADLSNADLTNANITKEQLGSCRSLAGATMPDGQILKGDIVPDGPTFGDWLKSNRLRSR
jgi:uncharacterized protein YjbI with pentapeptide repeats